MNVNQNIKKQFDDLLLFVTQITGCENAFIALASKNKYEICAIVGNQDFDAIFQLPVFEALINDHSGQIIFRSNKTAQLFDNVICKNFNFITAFSLKNENKVMGALFTFGQAKIFSQTQLNTLNYIQSQLTALIDLHTKNQQLQEKLNHKELAFESFLENANELFYELDREGNFNYISDNWMKLTGYSQEDLLGTSFSIRMHLEDLEGYISFLHRLLNNEGNAEEHTFRIKIKQGQYIWITSNVNAVQKENKLFFVGVAREVTKFVEVQNNLKQQKDFNEKILNELPTAIAVYDSDFRYQFLNPAAIQNDELRKKAIGMSNFEYEALSGRDVSFAINREERFKEVIVTRNSMSWEEEMVQKNTGNISYHERHLTPVFHQDGSLDMLVGIGINITKSKISTQELENVKKLSTNIIQNIAVGIVVQDANSLFIKNNDAACEMLGLSEDQLLGKTSFDAHWRVVHFDGTNFEAQDHPVPQAIKTLKPVNNIIMGVHRPKTKDFVWLLVDAVPVFDENQELIYVICSFNDITVQKKIEADLKIVNERFAYSLDATFDVIWEWDILTDKVFVGDNYTQQFGYPVTSENIPVINFSRHIHPEDLKNYELKKAKALAGTDLRWKDEYRFLKADGTFATVKDQAVIIRDAANIAIRMVGAVQDITEEVNLRNQVEHSEKEFKDAFNNSGAGMAMVDLAGNMKVVNNQILNILGYSYNELVHLNFAELSFPEDAELDQKKIQLLISGAVSNYTREKRYIHKNGSTIWGLISVSMIRNLANQPLHFITQIIDITQKKKIEKANELLIEENNKNKTLQLNEAKNLYRILADNMVDLVTVHDLEGVIQYVSPSLYYIFKYKSDEIMGHRANEFVHPEDVSLLCLCFKNIREEEGFNSAQVRFRKKDGAYIWCEIKGKLVKENGIPFSFHTSTREITETKKAEFAIEKTLKHEKELNELRTNLVSTVSHEFRTPMTSIRSSAELIALYLGNQKIENQSLIQKRIETIVSEIDRIVLLMNSILTIAKDDLGKTTFFPTVFDCKQKCLDVIEICEFDQTDNRKVNVEVVGDYFNIFADKNLVDYVLFNVLNNAFKYSMASEQNVTLKILNNGQYVVVEIIDYGIGIPKADQAKLCNTFFRASNTNGIQGTGLGLYIVKTFTERNGGKLYIQSELGVGTKIKLFFPLHKA